MTDSPKLAADQAMWVLRTAPEDDPFVFRIKPGGIKTIGRAPRADFILDAALVSRLHCRIEAALDGMDVVDLASTNGTYINDTRVENGRVQDGDRLRVGRVEFTVRREPLSS